MTSSDSLALVLGVNNHSRQEICKLHSVTRLTTLYAVLYPIAIALYRITFHPLARILGPRLLAIIGFYHQNHCNIKGDGHNEMVKLHKKYGPIVQIAPNHVAMDGNIGWSKVCASRLEDSREFKKTPEFLFPGDSVSLSLDPLGMSIVASENSSTTQSVMQP